MSLSQVHSVTAGSYIPDAADEKVSGAETLHETEARRTNGLYEAMLLAISFVLLLCGLLPSQKEQDASTRATVGK
jgi:hypothetical protein